MSIDKKLKEELRKGNNPRPFTNGAFIVPKKLEDGSWAWVVDAFEDDTFYEGSNVSVDSIFTDDIENLVNIQEDEED